MARTVNFEAITVSTTAVGLTAANLIRAAASPPIVVEIEVLTAPINVRADGGTPTNGVGGGTRFDVRGVFRLDTLPDLQNFRAIRTSDAGVDAVINVTYMA